MTQQHEEESLHRGAREQAEIERQTDALVLRTLTAMVTSAEDLKSKLRRDTEAILEGYRREKRSLENEISLATAERQRYRREAEQERDSIVAEAKEQAASIVEEAKRERETLLADVRTMEQRLRTLEGQIRNVLGVDLDAVSDADGDEDAVTDEAEPEAPAPAPAPAPAAPVAEATPAPSTPESAPAAPVPEPVMAAVTAPLPTPEPEPEAPALTATPEAAPTSAPRPVSEAAPTPAPDPSTPAPTPTAPRKLRLVELVFENVPGYQQASALEMAVKDLLPDEDVDIVEFENGQLVLSAQATDLDDLGESLVNSRSASLELLSVDGDRALFRCV